MVRAGGDDSVSFLILQRVGEEALSDERELWEAQFEKGGDVCVGMRKVDTLYVEADDV